MDTAGLRGWREDWKIFLKREEKERRQIRERTEKQLVLEEHGVQH